MTRQPARWLRVMNLRQAMRKHRPQGRRGWATAGLIAVLTAVTVGGLVQVRVDTGMGSLLPSGDASYQALKDKERSFGGDPVVVLLESHKPRELLLEQKQLARLLKLEGSLSRLPGVADVYGPATVLNQTAKSVQEMLAQISGRRDALRKEAEALAKRDGASIPAAKAAGDAAVAKFDRRYGALLARGLPAGLPTLTNSEFVANVLYSDDGQPKPQWQFVLPNEHTAAILIRPRAELDQAAAGRLADAVESTVDKSRLDVEKATVTGVPVVTSGLTERARHELPLLGAMALFAVGLIFLLVPWSRRRVARLRPPLAALLGTAVTLAGFGWLQHPLSLGVVAFLPILLGIGSDFPFYLSQPGNRRRALCAALAAVAGFCALALSPLPFVRELGLALAAGISAAVGIALGMRALFGPVPSAVARRARPPGELPSAPAWRRIAALTAAVAVAAIGWGVLPQLDIESQPDELAGGLPELKDARYAEEVLGSAGEVSIVLRGDNVLKPEALRWTQQVEDFVVRKHGDEIQPVITMSSLLRFLGDSPTVDQIAAGVQLMPSYLTSSVVRPDHKVALMTFGVELRDLSQQRALFADIRENLPRVPDGYETELVGLPVTAVNAMNAVSDGRILINMVGVVAAGMVLAVGLRQRWDAARAMLTVLLATGWVLTLIWATNGSLNPLTVAIGSLTTATGCEFAVMLAGAGSWRGHRLWNRVGTAALAGTIGYLVLGLSGIAVLREFGLLLAASVAFSFIAAIAVRWALPSPCRPSSGTPDKSTRTMVDETEVAV